MADQADGSAITVFRQQHQGILKLVAAVDLFTYLATVRRRNETPNPTLVEGLMSGKSMTAFAVLGGAYKPEDLQWIEENGSVRQLGQQIIVAAFTAIEWYLANKFAEYYRFIAQAQSELLVERSLRRLQRVVARSLSDARALYREFFDIDIRHFDLDSVSTTTGCSFTPRDGWDALQTISKARNEIVHTGSTISYAIRSLTDAYYPSNSPTIGSSISMPTSTFCCTEAGKQT